MRAVGRRFLHVVVGMSGGVDSAVSAHLLLKQGHAVSGLFATSWDGRDEAGVCSSDDDWRDVQRVCDQLGIACVRQSFVSDFWVDVFEPLVAGYASGLTPNPDVLCNRRVKFDKMRGYVLQTLGADLFATGHYAQLDRDPRTGKVRLLQSPCEKDQTLFLSQVSCSQLEHIAFPVGHLDKDQVRAIARDAGLHNADKKSSVGICFVGRRPFGEFIGDYLELTHGRFLDGNSGALIGRHTGAEKYTVGQRARVGGETRRLFVTHKTDNGDVLLGPSPPLSQSLKARDAVWIAEEPPAVDTRMRVTCRYRHTQQLQNATMIVSNRDPTSFVLHFDEAQAAVAAGQAVAVYDGNVCLGGASISHVQR
jgi:tRNA (5-methylaminomethyl-2-thiouridylate)-methyltransferase